MFDGVTAFTLYDTYGFPLDLTQDALRPRGIGVDIASFTDAMEEQRKKARASWAGSGEAADEAVWFGLREKVGATEFLGYETESAEGVVAALVHDGKEVAALKKGESGAVVLNQTPFYGESGGQVGDTGVLSGDGVRFQRHRYAEICRRPVRAYRHGRRGHAEAGHRRWRSRSITRGAARSVKIIRRRICCTKRCGRCSAITSRKKARWSRPTGCASTFRIRSR